MRFFRKKQDLKSYLTDTKYVSINGFEFIIKRINVMNYMEGTKVLLQTYETYTNARNQTPVTDDGSLKKILSHYTDVLCAGVAMPKIKREPTDENNEIHIDVLFNDMDLCNKLYESIIEFTYGKKKSKGFWSRGKELQTLSF